jgi:hypothetical protein
MLVPAGAMEGAVFTFPLHFVFAARQRIGYKSNYAPVAQLDRALPSEGRGQGFESLRVRQLFQ